LPKESGLWLGLADLEGLHLSFPLVVWGSDTGGGWRRVMYPGRWNMGVSESTAADIFGCEAQIVLDSAHYFPVDTVITFPSRYGNRQRREPDKGRGKRIRQLDADAVLNGITEVRVGKVRRRPQKQGRVGSRLLSEVGRASLNHGGISFSGRVAEVVTGSGVGRRRREDAGDGAEELGAVQRAKRRSDGAADSDAAELDGRWGRAVKRLFDAVGEAAVQGSGSMGPMPVEDALLIHEGKRVRNVLVVGGRTGSSGAWTGEGGIPEARQSARPSLDRDKEDLPPVDRDVEAAAVDRCADPTGGSRSQLG